MPGIDQYENIRLHVNFLRFYVFNFDFWMGVGFVGVGRESSFSANSEQVFWLSWRADL